jgi:hypothetical protein
LRAIAAGRAPRPLRAAAASGACRPPALRYVGSPVNIHEHIGELRRWLRDELDAPTIDEAFVVELSREEIGAAHLALSRDRVKTPEAFEARWAEIVSRGYSWINLSCYGLHGRTMIAAIELSREPTGVPRANVNFSGPPNDPRTGTPQWDGRDRIRIVD